MGTEDEVGRIAKKLEKIALRKDTSSTAQALDLLKVLQRAKVNLEMIQRTRIGLIVNTLRKSIHDEEVGTVAKSLIKAWKKLLEQKDALKDHHQNGEPRRSVPMDVNSNSNDSSQGSVTSSEKSQNAISRNSASMPFTGSSSGPAVVKAEAVSSTTSASSSIVKKEKVTSTSTSAPRKISPPSPSSPVSSSNSNHNFKQNTFASDTNDSVRLKCRDMLANALKPDDAMIAEEGDTGGGFYDPSQLGSLIEDAIFKEFRDTNMKYKNRIRSRVSNLGDKKNPDLKLNVLRGSIKPERIASMTAEEMASKEMQSIRQKYTKEAINDAQMSLTGGTKTDLLKCPNCKKSNCTYNQVQTRSADEPMTTFCYCNECGKRWKFC